MSLFAWVYWHIIFLNKKLCKIQTTICMSADTLLLLANANYVFYILHINAHNWTPQSSFRYTKCQVHTKQSICLFSSLLPSSAWCLSLSDQVVLNESFCFVLLKFIEFGERKSKNQINELKNAETFWTETNSQTSILVKLIYHNAFYLNLVIHTFRQPQPSWR